MGGSEAGGSARRRMFPVVLAAALAGVLAGLGVVWAVGNSPAQPGPVALSASAGPASATAAPVHVGNPYQGADGYVNPDWSAQVVQLAEETGGELGARIRQVSQEPTFVWIGDPVAVNHEKGLALHLDRAVLQDAANGTAALVFQLVVGDLTLYSCAEAAQAGAMSGELERYQRDYIDAMAQRLDRQEYRGLRIVAVLRSHLLGHLITDPQQEACRATAGANAHVAAMRYAMSRLAEMDHVYLYLDAAHSDWLGRSVAAAAALYADVVLGQDGPGPESIDGIAVNIGGYAPLEEPFLPDPKLKIGGKRVQYAAFYGGSGKLDELDYALALRKRLLVAGLPDDLGVLFDTGRNGWGGPGRPAKVSTATEVNAYVDASRIDRRPQRGLWCNQVGAGLGARPQSAPAEQIDAYVWIKPPGDSDGAGNAICDPQATLAGRPTNAMPGAPPSGQWFPEHFAMLAENAYPPLTTGESNE